MSTLSGAHIVLTATPKSGLIHFNIAVKFHIEYIVVNVLAEDVTNKISPINSRTFITKTCLL